MVNNTAVINDGTVNDNLVNDGADARYVSVVRNIPMLIHQMINLLLVLRNLIHTAAAPVPTLSWTHPE